MDYTIYEKDGVLCSIPNGEDISMNNILIAQGFRPFRSKITPCENEKELYEFLDEFHGDY
ncbi:hypothetical protein FDI95_gp031 [Citrobacter phage CF1 ERZ-2017]|uniref:Uncharacterized protein n=1 Tax=Citrobacter phage CF1 ERZ-2017 TaxID=2267236 RepID=A0A2H4YFX1_9CAUD|nr:hypothetical protein FDI95_gp031 [Citrobacter phage CF1 ERZ-2017]AUE22904.1 hypothetical protein Cf1_00031 [Citrobacter phage CF1 ERZ-2017]